MVFAISHNFFDANKIYRIVRISFWEKFKHYFFPATKIVDCGRHHVVNVPVHTNNLDLTIYVK